ncbi:high-affinity branched-chain amino acid transport ATP-binding protein LivF (plasmid) [Cupriavidus necator N-1]|uniref:High-affinity branched-chain amino acid transport ATP-binding protein LivF n=1 Tax=Cupriavidus necator (strain ATCC 43291 / DSM 13513 / CCUG 52238 / LMG 8453 / N-1) TaxID=1042878 RepID=F8GV90_CUPNN|nr:ABC transporter ATP-binding protein [Cupriavidus necator]AEI82590.1 high-affinity branched-chain amino acid transport ATP-binding protein LivF [Cupriavidus necator N-1]AEI82717.1 high-affinity branched-chain amino acid transport ATP-binding protein LivF [Cupriavidus necator N-1]MDX6007591.1 ABC transporter ATP-binding protein [Cupriavidus necator]MDX6007711.1 ABC transporter ATP-binding protein [Cupriavidus necator]
MSLLELTSVEAGYGASQVLFGVDLFIDEGEVVTLLGRNGMGKSTTVKATSGLLRPMRGSVRFNGCEVAGMAPERISRNGIGLVPEGRRIFSNLTVYENLVAFARRGQWTLQRIYKLFPVLERRKDNMGFQLSGGEQQMLAISRALLTNARLLLIDEATEGLAPLIRQEIWRCLHEVKREGQSILVIDKYVQNLIGLADRHYFIENGRIGWTGSSAQLSEQPEIWERYLGV